jgi:hypothetical protein
VSGFALDNPPEQLASLLCEFHSTVKIQGSAFRKTKITGREVIESQQELLANPERLSRLLLRERVPAHPADYTSPS